MTRPLRSTERESAERQSLRRRVKSFYRRFNEAGWDDCYALIDPQLTRPCKVKPEVYSERLRSFKGVYGSVQIWWTRLNLYLSPTRHQRDKRPFAYVYVFWQDDAHGFHLFRERWVKDNGRWFTRVVGLVPNRPESATTPD